MTEFPVSLDGMISFVKSLHPGGDPLQNLADAFTVSAQLDDQSDALIGHFVDQARRSGASWSEIGASMGVSKQAVQKRFVSVWESAEFSRFTQRTRNALGAAARAAAASGAASIDATHMVAGLLAVPDGIAAKAVHGAGLGDEQVLAALGTGPADGGGDDTDAAALRAMRFTEAGRAALRAALTAALRLSHNYIGTEHLLLGILQVNGEAARKLTGLGLSAEVAQQRIAAEFAAVQARRQAG
jgi:Clp amino terminal domain, pathogenicity island component